MNSLYQKYHGLPGIGIKGEQGASGTNGHNVYYGFVNDFFDGINIPQDSNAKIVRKVNTDNYDSKYIAAIAKNVPDGDTIFNVYKTKNTSVYYSGSVVSSSDMEALKLSSTDFPYGIPVDVNPTSLQTALELGTLNILYNNLEYSLTNISEVEKKTYDYQIIDNVYTLGTSNNIIAIPLVSNTTVAVTYEPVDAAVQIGQFTDFQNFNTTNASLFTALGANAENLSDEDLTAYSAFLNNQIKNTNSAVDKTMYFAETVSDVYGIYDKSTGKVSSYKKYDNKDYITTAILSGQSGEGKMYSITKNAIVLPTDVINSDDETVLFSVTNTDTLELQYYYGLPYNILYGYKNGDTDLNLDTESTILAAAKKTALGNYSDIKSSITTYYNSIQYTINKKFGFFDDTETFNEDDFVIYELQENNYIRIPTTLSSNYKVGDIIYFYTSKPNLTNEIPYMIVVTEDLLNVDLATFISKATIVNPLDVTILYTNNNTRAYTTNNIICNNINKLSPTSGEKFTYNSMSNIIDSYYNTNLILTNYASSSQTYLTLRGLISDPSVDTSTGKTVMNTTSKSLNFSILNGSLAIAPGNKSTYIKFDNLCGDDTTYTSNVELKGALYDDNIILNNGFLTNFTGVDEYLIENQLYLGMQLQASDYFKDTTNLSNYVYGYELYQTDHQLIQTNCTNGETLLVLIPVYKVDSDFIKYNSNVKTSTTITIAESFTLTYYGSKSLEWNNLTFTYSTFKTINGYPYLIYDSGVASKLDSKVTVKLYVGLNINDKSEITGYKFYAPVHYDPTTSIYRYAEYVGPDEASNDHPNIQSIQTIYADDINYSIASSEEIIYNDEILYTIEYDIVAFATNVYGVKYYSKFAKITLNIIEDILDSFKLEIYGENASLVSANDTSNITFTTNGITAENSSGALLIEPADGYSIEEVYINNKLVNSYENNWATIEGSEVLTESLFSYNYDLQENIADANTSYGNIDCSTIKEYAKSYADEDGDANQCKLFSLLNDGLPLPSQAQRSVVFTAKYQDGSNNTYYESYKLTQPGFKDTRDIPDVSLYIHTDMEDLEKYNSNENGVLCNQFRTYLDITINDVQSTWGPLMSGNAKVTLDMNIDNIPTDPTWVKTYNAQNNVLVNRSTIKIIPNQLPKQISQYYNYVSLSANLVDDDNKITSYETVDISCNPFLQSRTDNASVNSVIVDDKEYIMFDSSMLNYVTSPLSIAQGIQDNISIQLRGLTLKSLDEKNMYRIQLDFDMSNPVIANLYLRFAVSYIRFNYYEDDTLDTPTATFTVKIPSVKDTTLDTYIYKFDGTEETYKFLSNKLDVMINPVSYTICPASEETNIVDIQGAVKKVGSDQEIKKKLEMYQQAIYTCSEYYNQKDDIVRSMAYLKWNPLLLKTKYLQDNIQNIAVTNIDIDKDNMSDIHTALFKDMSPVLLQDTNTFDPIDSNKYISIVYNSIIMNPKLRDGEYTFYYNDDELSSPKYSQLANNYPVFTNQEATIEVRSEKLVNSIDTWNFEYTNSKNKSSVYNVFTGVINKYGNGYNYLTADVDIDQYDEKSIYSLAETKSLNNTYIYDVSNAVSMSIKPISSYEPDKNKYYRTFLYDINWEYPVYLGSNNVTAYQIVSDLDYVLAYIIKNGGTVNSTDYLNHIEKVIKKNSQMVPYNEVFELTPRIACNTDQNTINVLMLRKPAIGEDKDDTLTIYDESYNLSTRYFELSDGLEIKKLTLPYTYKN